MRCGTLALPPLAMKVPLLSSDPGGLRIRLDANGSKADTSSAGFSTDFIGIDAGTPAVGLSLSKS